MTTYMHTDPPRGRMHSDLRDFLPLGRRIWYAQVVHDGKVVWEDNSTNWQALCDELRDTLEAFRHLHWLGQVRFYSWKTIVDNAPEL